jgi:hypothetical protein
MAVGKGAHQLETLTGDEQRLSRKHVAQRFHQLSREMGEVRKRLVAHGFADAHRTAQQVSLVGALGTVCPDVVATCRRDVSSRRVSLHHVLAQHYLASTSSRSQALSGYIAITALHHRCTSNGETVATRRDKFALIVGRYGACRRT